MPTLSLFADPRADDDRSSALVSRQPVVDRDLRVTGYRIAYAPLDGADLEAADDLTATRLFADVLGAVGLSELVGERPAHLPVSRRLLLALGVPPVRPDRVVLRVPYAAAVDQALDEVLTAICRRGYSLSLHDLPGIHFNLDLLKRYGTVEVDCAEWDWEQAGFAAARIQEYRAAPMAVELAGHTEFELARSLGFELFTGSFYSSPRMTELRSVPVGSLGTLVSLARLRADEAAVEELEEVIDRDIGLSVKLLRYINSAYFGVRSKVGSIRQAVMLLGSRGICRWALMVALAGGPSARVSSR
jgi:c-di-GMP phosphodiesterase